MLDICSESVGTFRVTLAGEIQVQEKWFRTKQMSGLQLNALCIAVMP